MPGRVVRPSFEVSEPDRHPRHIEHVDGRRRFDTHAEHRSHRDRVVVQEGIAVVQIHGGAGGTLGCSDARDVIDVRMCQENVLDRELRARGVLEEFCHRVTRINERSVASALASDDESIFLKRTARTNFHYHDLMVLAVVDDLMFTSKIKAAARQLGVDVTFARSSDAAISGMRASAPALVILDLNNPRTDPLGTVAVMKGDPALKSIPTVGFVSHVQADLIEAARAAGVDDVLARSAFTARLSEILGGR